ncbi:neutral zinc metallopeptidase [Luteococcus sp. OSA5]|uniref:neutral zinc metallopeptidase n=1 Tax=Luteococcus sp. OSA5 TaxID=3401630 RepID=UPI003B431B09
MTQNPWGNRQANPWGPPQGSPWGPPTVQSRRNPYARPQQTPYPNPYAPGSGQVVFGGRPPQRPRRNPFATLLKALILLAVLGFLGLVALGWLLSQVVSTIELPEPTQAPTLSQPSAQPSLPERSETGGPRPSPEAGNYQNDGYVVPPVDRNPPGLPEPETYEKATDLLKANPLYDSDIPSPVRCEMAEIDVDRASRSELTEHLNQMMGCLMRVWDEPLQQAGFQAVRPSVTVYSNPVTTKCGKLPMQNAVYCGADQQVYYAQDLPRVIPRELRDSRFITESVVAHEFGHAVQARSAILVSELAWEEKSNKSTALQLSRRLEVQADCMAGMFLGSIQQSTDMTDEELQNVGKLFYSIGDDVLTGRAGYEGNHGSGQSRLAWTNRGLQSTSVARCNSFTAPADEVR